MIFFFKTRNSAITETHVRVFNDGAFSISSLLSVVISNSKQVDIMNAVTEWLMYDVIYSSQTATIQTGIFNQSVIIIIYAMNV